MGWLDRFQIRRPWRRRATPPPAEARTWLHPSELPSFDSLGTSPTLPTGTRTVRLLGATMIMALLVGGAGLASTSQTPPANEPMSAHVTLTVAALPAAVRLAARRTVDLTITTSGHVASAAAMVLPHDLAVTTTPIARDALLTASVPGHANFPVTWIGRDNALGFTIVRLSVHVPALVFGPLPSSSSVIALSPVITGPASRPRFAWANTTLGDPTLRANGIVGYLAAQSVPHFDGIVDALAVNHNGRVVAVLSAGHLWYSAQFVARVAAIVATGHGCHADLGVVGASAQGGGVAVRTVVSRSAATHLLQAGDVVTSLNGHTIDSWDTLLTVLYLTPALTRARIAFIRHSVTHHAVVTLGCAP